MVADAVAQPEAHRQAVDPRARRLEAPNRSAAALAARWARERAMSDPGRAPASQVPQDLAATESAAAVHPWVADAEDLQKSPESATAHRDVAHARAAREHRAAREACLGPTAAQPPDRAVPTTGRRAGAVNVRVKHRVRAETRHFRRCPAALRFEVPPLMPDLAFHSAPKVQAEPKTGARRRAA